MKDMYIGWQGTVHSLQAIKSLQEVVDKTRERNELREQLEKKKDLDELFNVFYPKKNNTCSKCGEPIGQDYRLCLNCSI